MTRTISRSPTLRSLSSTDNRCHSRLTARFNRTARKQLHRLDGSTAAMSRPTNAITGTNRHEMPYTRCYRVSAAAHRVRYHCRFRRASVATCRRGGRLDCVLSEGATDRIDRADQIVGGRTVNNLQTVNFLATWKEQSVTYGSIYC